MRPCTTLVDAGGEQDRAMLDQSERKVNLKTTTVE